MNSKPRFYAWRRFLLPRIFYLRENLERRRLNFGIGKYLVIKFSRKEDDMENKYVLTKSSKTLHIINGCCHSKNPRNDLNMYEFFKTEDEAISKHQNHIKHCRICFRNR